jgi:hypothetical protein
MVQGTATRIAAYAVSAYLTIGGGNVGGTGIAAAATGLVAWSMDVWIFIVDATTAWINAQYLWTNPGATNPPNVLPSPVINRVQGVATMTNLALGIQPIVSISTHTFNAGNKITRLRSVVYAA